jgi:hypothetical protein
MTLKRNGLKFWVLALNKKPIPNSGKFYLNSFQIKLDTELVTEGGIFQNECSPYKSFITDTIDDLK